MKLTYLLLFIPFLASADIHPSDLTIANVKKMVATLKQNDWKTVFSGIATGQKEWLGVVPVLATVTNQNQSVELERVMGAALSANTTEALKTLAILDTKKYPFMIGSDIVCGVPTEKSDKEIAAFYQRTRDALLDTDAGATCLWILEATYDEWQHSH
jgi:hypothetical protein